MFWIVMMISFIVLGFVFLKKFDLKPNSDTGFCLVGWIPAAMMAMVIATSIGANVGLYTDLLGARASVVAIKSEIDNIREAHYPEVIRDGNVLVAGSIENIKQSTNLSEYINRYASAKALYNSHLVIAQAKKKLFMYRMFSQSSFIPNEVLELEEIK